MADADLFRIKRNVAKMAAQGAPETEIDGYISSEGTTIDAVKSFKIPDDGRPSLTSGEGRVQQKGFMPVPEDNPDKMAPMFTQVGAGLPSDVTERAKFYAERRFGDRKAVDRYGIEGGRLYYVDDDGKAFYEEGKPSLSSPQSTAKYLASGIGPALPTAGSVGAVLPQGPGAFMGGIPAAAAGGAAGDATRQLLAKALAGDESGYNFSQTAKEAALAGGGQAIGAGLVKLGNRAAARDISKIADPQSQARIAYLDDASKELGISLTPAEKTNLRSLRGQQNLLADLPPSADVMGDFLQNRNMSQVPAAVSQGLGKISPVESREVGAQLLREGSEGVIKGEKEALRKAAAPLYEQAYKANQNVASKEVDRILATPAGRNALKGAATKMQNDMTLLGVPDAELAEQAKLAGTYEPGGIASGLKLRTLDYVKRSLDDQINTAMQSGAKDDARLLTGLKNKLLKELDAADVTAKAGPNSLKPEGGAYARARAMYAGEMPNIQALEKSEIGIASRAGDTQLKSVPRTMFEAGPNAVAANRTAFEKAGRMDEWNAGLRSYLSDAFNTASKEFKSGNNAPGAAWRARVFGTPEQKASLRSAMTNEQWAGFNRLMDVLEATGRATPGGSRTIPAGEAVAEMKSQAGGNIGKLTKVLSPQNIGQNLGDWYQNLKYGQHAEKLAEIITSPDAMKQLKALKTLSPNSAKARVIVAQVLTATGATQAGRATDPKLQNAAPGSLSTRSARPQ